MTSHDKKEEERDGLRSAEGEHCLIGLFADMCLIRAFEERVSELYRDAAIPGFIHTSIGQEAVAVGVCAALRDDDHVATTHRGHGHCLAKGADVNAAMAELFGKKSGLCGGKGGSMHLADSQRGILGANAIVGASLGIAIGAALTTNIQARDSVAVAFFGEGAVDQGIYHEALNLAAIWALPVIFVCENNIYTEFTDSRSMSCRSSVITTSSAYEINAAEVDGNDVEAVLAATREAVALSRRGEGPFLIEALTYRWHGHYEGDRQAYKPAHEVEEWKLRDPLLIGRKRIQSSGAMSATELDAIQAKALADIDAAEEFARKAAYPQLQDLLTHVYCE